MTDAVAVSRRTWPRAAPGLRSWRSALGRRIVATHLVTAAVAVVATLAVAGGDPTALRVAGAAALALAAAISVGTRLAATLVAPLARMLRAVDAEAAKGGDELAQLSAGQRRLLATLADRTAAAGTFAADVAHEIRNPLTSVRAAAEALVPAGPEQRARLVELIGRDVDRLDRLVGEIAAAARLDAELVHERGEAFDLAATIDALNRDLAPVAAERGVELVTVLPARPLPVLGLEARLAQVLLNLVDNAISLCEPGDAIRVRALRQGRRVLVIVEDTGPGIPEGEGERIFRRFYSCRAGQAGANSGLGLAIARQIVEAHGGAIWAETIRPTASDLLSEPMGARFVVVLPQ